jgi:hypothetical protein
MPAPRLLLAIALATLLAHGSVAGAAPGDHRLLTGTLISPADATAERTLVIQSEDGVIHFVELGFAESIALVRVGDRVSVIGREGFQPTHILFAHLAHREDIASAPPALPLAVSIAPVTDVRESPDVVTGTVESVAGRTLRVTNRHGHRITVDVAAIDADIRGTLRPGDVVTVFAPTRISGLPVAAGIVVESGPAPAAR